jgi:hypothetical protein
MVAKICFKSSKAACSLAASAITSRRLQVTVKCTFMQAIARMDDQGVKKGIKPILFNRREVGFWIDLLVTKVSKICHV